ncbi:sugar phosphate isomerase/epimerase family protein [Leucobacter sp. HNU]|uniref:sugar phosphate isomerase/epimerase family protein n=1 Tax=Leucobacter sp. HNU TaxID=3236805 RepID=UPI003A80DF9A
MDARVAGAPVSFGVFELTPEGVDTIAPDQMLEILDETGYAGIDLGPAGYLGEGEQLISRLRAHSFGLAGGWVQLPMSDDAAFDAALPELDAALAVFADAAAALGGPDAFRPKPTLADSGSAARQARPGLAVDPLDAVGWDRLAANAARAAERVRAAGLEPTFHHHAGTFVESPDEVERFLDRVDVGLTFDTGHLLLGGGDPAAVVDRWAPRINHLHLKDVDRAELARVIDAGGGMVEVWSSGAFAAFGGGDIDLATIMNAMDRAGYAGWVVVEQDVLPEAGIDLVAFAERRRADHRTNREALRPWA